MTWANKVYVYQTGRRLDVPANVRLGEVILVYAKRRAIEAGRRVFHLLADEAPYKLQLAPAARSLVQVRVIRSRTRERCVEAVRPMRRGAVL